MSHSVEQITIALFHRFIARETTLLDNIQAFGGSFEVLTDRWVFSLKDLHAFVMQQTTDDFRTPYTRFRNSLYQSDINHQLSASNAIIELHHRGDNVDLSLYCLRIADATSNKPLQD